MKKQFLDIIVGARPNFIKLASIINASRKMDLPFDLRIIHTGQHYDEKMNKVFFKQLNLPNPDINLNVGSGTSGFQVANIIIKYEYIVLENKPFMIIVIGDVNSTVAASIVAKQNNILLGHIEAGIRSFDREMPEEINRIITDSISDYFYVTTKYAIKNLKKNGVNNNNIIQVGNTMIDTLIKSLNQIDSIKPLFPNKTYIILTLHRVSNTKDTKKLKRLFEELEIIAKDYTILFPAHPGTYQKILNANIEFKNIKILEPLPYFEFLSLLKGSICVISDSGGITEEASFLNIPCLTLRNNTERPETIEFGTNVLIKDRLEEIRKALNSIKTGNWKKYRTIEMWDELVGERILNHIKTIQIV
jgi:UDP-N-acetylglucosamine 2-epimerase (non-hydrolysing)